MAKVSERTALGYAVHVLPAALYATCIFIGGSLPQGPETGLEFDHQDKVLHLLAFGGFQWLTWRALRYLQPRRSGGRQLLWAAAISIAAGALLEVWQSFLPTREAEALDLLADALGALLAALVLWYGERSKRVSPAG